MQIFGRYELHERIGIGGMAEVFRARSSGAAGVAKELVIKKILPHLSEDEHFRNMFLNEAKIAVNLTHANIVQVFDFGEVDGQYFLAMEYIDGTDLRQVLKDLYKANSRIPLPYALYIASECCKGLDYAHRKTDEDGKPLGIIHRDISPQNILISVEGEIKVADFGIAKAANIATETRSGAIKGKLSYLAPEHIARGEADKRSDLFALGVCLHEMLTGKPLFAGRGELEILKRIESGDYPKPSEVEPWLPTSIDEVVMKALETQPRDRYQTAAEFHEAIGDIAFEAGARLEPTGLASFIREHFRGRPRGTPPPSAASSPEALERTSISGSNPVLGHEPAAPADAIGSPVGGSEGVERLPQQPLAMEVQQDAVPEVPPVQQSSAPVRQSSHAGSSGVMPKEHPAEERSARSLTIPPSRQAVSFVGKRDANWKQYGILASVIVVLAAVVTLSALDVIPVRGWVDAAMGQLYPDATPTPSRERVTERLAEFRKRYGTVEASTDELLGEADELLAKDTMDGYAAAREALEKAMVVDEKNVDALSLLAEVYALQARYDGEPSLLADAIQFAEAAREYDSTSVAAHRAKATVLAFAARSNASNAREAIDILNKEVLPSQADDPQTRFLLGMALAATDPSRAEKALHAAIDGGVQRAHYELGLVYRDQGRWSDAVHELAKVRHRFAVAGLERGRLYEQMGRYRDAVHAYDDAAGVSEQGPRLVCEAQLRAAIVHYQALGSERTAQRLLESAYRQIENVPDAEIRNGVRIHLAHVYRQQRKYTRSLEIALEVLEENDASKRSAAHFAAGMAYLRKRNNDEAGQHFTKAVSSNIAPRDRSEALYYLALAQAAHSSRLDEARHSLDRAAKLDPHNFKAPVFEGLILIQQKQDQAAVRKVAAMGSNDPLFSDNCRCFTDFYGDETDLPYRRAEPAFEDLATNRRSYDATAWSALGLIRFHGGDRLGAWKAFDRALDEDSSNEVARLYNGVRYELAGGRSNLMAAAREYEAARGSEFSSAYLYTALARIYLRQGKVAKAESNAVRALGEDPDYAPALFWQGKIRQSRRDPRGAEAHWRKALEADPDFTAAARAIYELRS